MPPERLQNFKTLFLGVVLEALPFLLLGVIVSALIHVFVSESTIRRIVPKHPIPGIAFASLLGVVLPLCECGMIPIVRRLIRKGMPAYVGMVYILTGPILNPIVFASTYMAFRNNLDVVYGRMGVALACAVVIGAVLYRTVRTNPLREGGSARHHDHDHDHVHEGSTPQRLMSAVDHAAAELFDMGKYFVFGALLTASLQVAVSRDAMVAIGEGTFSSHLFMMGFAYVLSICSTSDAFVAASFATTFPPASLLTFLVFGPMLDVKNTLMLLAAFRLKFVIGLLVLVPIVVLASVLTAQALGFV